MRRGDRRTGPLAVSTRASAWLGAAILMVASPVSALGDRTNEKIADVAEPLGFGQKTVEGVGLVVGLAGTGSEPRPSAYRSKLETEIKRIPELKAADILGDPLKQNSLVVVRATISAGMTPQDELNIEVLLPPDSETSSLEGGFLVGTWLHEVGIASGGQLDGKQWVYGYGPVLTGSEEEPDNVKTGQILGGGRIKQEVPYILLIGERYRSGAVAKQIQELINTRFEYRDGRFKKGVATAKTDNTILLNVPEHYHQNQLRYLQVLSQIRLIQLPELLEPRFEEWGKELLDPATAGEAALKLEAMGGIASEVLIKGLDSDHPQVRFFAAEALAYLNNSAGFEELAQTAMERSEFRTLALAALAATKHSAGYLRLRELMDEADPIVRYGAFNALRATDPTDPYLGRTRVLGLLEERRRANTDDSMAFRIDGEVLPPAQPAEADPFDLYVVRSSGPPMIHVSRSRRREIVLFGEHQELLSPVVLGGAGPILLNAGTEDRRIELSRIDLNGSRPQVLTSSPDLVELIRTLTALNATYPQIVSILEGANAQANLETELMVDAVPAGVEAYDRAQLTGEDVTKDEAVSRASFIEEEDTEARRPGFGLFKRLLPRKGAEESGSDAPLDEAVEQSDLESETQESSSKSSGIFSRLRKRSGAEESQSP